MGETKTYYYCNVEGNTDIGCKRKANEDWLDSFECKNGLVAVVCDGMGGHVGGQIASHVAVDAIRLFLESQYFDNPKEAIVAACDAANQAILQRATEQPELNGMGSTCVMLIVRNGKVYIGSVGDSRIYLIRSKKIRQLTKDQSYVQMLVDMGEISKEQAERHPRKNEITNALGLPSMQPATVLDTPICPEAGDCFLLCSDGLSGMVPETEIVKVVSNQTGLSQRDRVNTLINRARQHGGLDNITCQIVEFAVTPPGLGNKNSMKNKALKIGLPVLAILLLVIGGGVCWWKQSRPQESKYVKEMKAKPNATLFYPNDTIKFVPGKKVFEIEENKQFGALAIYVFNESGKAIDTISIKKALKIASLSIEPKENVTLKSGARLHVQFNDREYTEPDISLTFKDNDSIYMYVFKVSKPQREEKSFGDAFVEENGTHSIPSGKSGNDETVLLDKTGDTDDAEILEATVKAQAGDSTTIQILSMSPEENPNTETKIYIDYAIEPKEVRGTWYSYECPDGQTCTITILNSNIPGAPDNQIKIPLANQGGKQFTLWVERR